MRGERAQIFAKSTLTLCLWALAFVASSSSAQDAAFERPNEPKTAIADFKYDWAARLFGLGVSDSLEQSRISGLQLYGGAQYQFSPYLDVEGDLRGRFETGSTHSLYEINRVANGIWLDEARANAHPFPGYFTLSAGALNQRYLKNPLLFDEVSFPAVQEKVEISRAQFSLGVVAEQAIPSSTSLSTRSANNEPLPTLYTETLFAGVKPTPDWEVNALFGAFAFKDLPSQVAFDSFSQGNIVDADVPQNARFSYAFQGLNYGLDTKFSVAPGLQFKLGGAALVNNSAPSRYAHGLLTFAQATAGVGGGWNLVPRWEYFRNERQSSPAFYNSPDYGHNNRHGFAYELRLENMRRGLAIKARYTDAYLIEEDPLQANSQIFMFYLEVFNAAL